jgi:hypothetical protein
VNLCNTHEGDEVCFEGRTCPACALQKERDEANDRVGDLERLVKEERQERKAELENWKDGNHD